MKELEIESDLRKFKEYLEANGVRVLAASLFVEVRSKERVAVLGNNEMLAEMAICTLAGMNGLMMVRRA